MKGKSNLLQLSPSLSLDQASDDPRSLDSMPFIVLDFENC